jgi:hypothetical protein
MVSGDVLMLVDVEGSEPKVLAGGAEFIRRTLPCIIFEYNEVSKRYFALGQVRGILGDGYDVYRLRCDGRLDQDFRSSWNCVAVHRQSVWAAKCRPLLVSGHWP